MTAPYYSDELECECRCGSVVQAGRRFVTGHNLRCIPRTAEYRARIGEGQRRAWATSRKRKPLGSRRLDANGYWLIKVREGGGRWDKEHVLAMEASIGRRLLPGEHVHHINAVRADNRIENLYLAESPTHHALIHSSFDALLPALIESGAVTFDRETGRYCHA